MVEKNDDTYYMLACNSNLQKHSPEFMRQRSVTDMLHAKLLLRLQTAWLNYKIVYQLYQYFILI